MKIDETMKSDIMPEMSEKFDIILRQLMKAKQEMGTVIKDSKNPFHKSNYASLGAYIDASEHHLMCHDIILIQTGNGNFEKPMIISTLMHPESGQWIKSYLPLLNPKGDSQGLGSAVTYMRRYSLALILGLVAIDDDAEASMNRQEKVKGRLDKYRKKEEEEKLTNKISKTDRINAEKLHNLLSLKYQLDEDCDKKISQWLLKCHGIKEYKDVTNEIYDRLFISLNNALKLIQQKKIGVQKCAY